MRDWWSPRVLGATLLALVFVAAAAALGTWQLDSWRAQNEAAARDLTERDPVALTDVLGPDDPFPGRSVGQPVTVSGTWVPDATVYVEGRESEGRDGYWVVTPLELDPSSPAAARTGVAVVRGWTGDLEQAPAPPTGRATLVGWLQPPEGTGVADEDPTDDVYPQLRAADLVQRVDADLYGAYAVLDPERSPEATAATAGLAPADLEQLPKPPSTALRNFLYALEWFVFAGFAIFIWWRFLREGRQHPASPSEPAGSAEPDDDTPGPTWVPRRDAVTAPGTVDAVSTVIAPEVRVPLVAYRVMASIVGVLLVVLILVGVPLANFDGTQMWHLFPTPDLVATGSTVQEVGQDITTYLGVAHGWLYMAFLFAAFWLSRRAEWPLGFTLVTLLCGTVPLLSFWAEHRATRRVRHDYELVPV